LGGAVCDPCNAVGRGLETNHHSSRHGKEISAHKMRNGTPHFQFTIVQSDREPAQQMQASETKQGAQMSDSQSSSSEEDDRLNLEIEGTEDEEDVEAAPEIVSLLDSKVFPSATLMLDYCQQQFGFDFLGTRIRLQLDFYGTVKLVNFGEFHPSLHCGPGNFVCLAGWGFTAAFWASWMDP
jgi:hypothetical protein